MADNVEIFKARMLKAEEEVLDTFEHRSLEGLIFFFNEASKEIFEDSSLIEEMAHSHNDAGYEAVFSTFRVLKGIMAEIEYRLRENKI